MRLDENQAADVTGVDTSEFTLNLVFKEIDGEDGHYFVAECLEIPGCVSQGDTHDEADRNIRDAVSACLSVIFEDRMRRLMEWPGERDLRGISSQTRLRIDPTPRFAERVSDGHLGVAACQRTDVLGLY